MLSRLLDSTHLLARTVDALDIYFTLSLVVPFYANAHLGNVTFIHVKGILPYTIISFNCFDCILHTKKYVIEIHET